MKNQDGTWAIKASGGAREGAGRPSTGRKKVNLYITDQEKVLLILYLDKLRNETQS